jgi:RHS repeat-associated protein
MTAAVGARNLFKVDAGVVHALLQQRYYDASKGAFLSEDPVFLAVGNPAQVQQISGQDQTTFLSDPQQTNSYSYANDNPLTKSDPSGRLAPEALVGAGIGGVVGVTLQGFSDLASGRASGLGTYAGAFTGGAVYGGIIGATDGASLLVTLSAGAASGAAQSATTQGISIADGSQNGFNGNGFLTDTGIGIVGAAIPGIRVRGVTAGRDSFLAVQNQIYTKLGTGSVSPTRIAMPTFGKMFVATGAQQAPGAAVQGILSSLSSVLTRLNSLLSSMAPTASAPSKSK